MKVSVRLIALLISLMVCAMCFAQGGGGQRGGQRFGRGGAQMFNSWGTLLRLPAVETELAVTDDEKTKISDLRTSLRGQGGGGGQGARPTPEEMAARTADQNKQYEALLTPTQVTRLHELRIQWMGDESLNLPEVQTGLNLSADQIAKVKSTEADYQTAQQAIGEKMRNQEIQMADAQAASQKNQDALKTTLHGILTPDQATKLTAMGGKPLEKPAMSFGGRRGGGGGGAGGGAAARGGGGR